MKKLRIILLPIVITLTIFITKMAKGKQLIPCSKVKVVKYGTEVSVMNGDG